MLALGVVIATINGATTATVGPPNMPWFDPTLPTPKRAAALVAAISPQDRVHQLVTDSPSLPDQAIPAYMWRSNVLHGLVDNGVSTQFPQATGLAASWDQALLRAVGEVCSTEQRAKHNIATNFSAAANTPMDYGVDLWGPNINMLRDGRWGRGQETYGEDPVLTGSLAAAFIDGLQYGPVPGVLKTIATAKHFDAYSLDREPPRLSFDPNISDADLHQYYFPAFVDVVKAGVRSIMCAYNGINGHPMCESPLIKSILRDEMGFDGYVVTDSGAVDFMVSFFHRYQNTTYAAAAALNAGCDLNSGSAFLKLSDALDVGLIDQQQIDTALTRLFEARIDAGLLNPPKSVEPYTSYSQTDILSADHRALALQAAEESIVLLRNEHVRGKPLLPLGETLSAGAKIAVVGPAANDTFRMMGNYYGCSFGTWGPVLDNCSVSTLLDGATRVAMAHGAVVTFNQGCDQESNDTSQFAAAVNAAKGSDVVIAYLGLRNCEGGQGAGGPSCESEGHDRDSLDLPGVQGELLQHLVATGTPVVLVLTNGGPVSIKWASANVPAIVDAWYGGIDGGIGVANVLFGVDGVSPAGRMPFMVPQSVAQLPDELNMALEAPPFGRTYRYFSDTPLYNFGYGLSYTTFSYSQFTLSSDSVSAAKPENVTACVTVSNTGTRSSEEVVQVYASRTKVNEQLESVPKVQLVAFNRTAVVAAGASVQVCLGLNVRHLYLLGADGNFGLQPGHYMVYVGGSCPGTLGLHVDRSTLQTPLARTLAISL
mmetsp:Transcript_29627/g.88644  ORF Transcript_29627/g.88644 Transcript_29627/m.88644 type:complete len:767 (+) Transcript_29627:57-2357(+)